MASILTSIAPKPTTLLSKFSFFKRSKENFTYAYQFKCIEKVITDVTILQTIPITTQPFLSHQLTMISNDLKPRLITMDQDSISSKLNMIDTILSKRIADYQTEITTILSLPLDEPLSDEQQMIKQLYYRLTFTKHYLKSLEQSIKHGTIPSKNVEKKLSALIDCSLRGTSAERILEHLFLYGTELHQDTLQLAFYALYEPEIQTTATLLPLYPFQRQKKQMKIHTKLASTYLLDKLELNTKTRCVFAWSDPTYTGFKPLPDSFLMPTAELARGRRSFFPDGERVAKFFMETVKDNLQEEENNHTENQENLRNGTYFFIATCFLDWIVCTL